MSWWCWCSRGAATGVLVPLVEVDVSQATSAGVNSLSDGDLAPFGCEIVHCRGVQWFTDAPRALGAC